MIAECPSCGSPRSDPVVDLPSIPVFCNVLCPTLAEAHAVKRASLRLVHCGECDLVWNADFDASQIAYSGAYENALHFSPHFRDYADTLVEHLVEEVGLRDCRVLEIGCGDGSFLAELCRRGNNRGIGFDPSHDPSRSAVPDGARVEIQTGPFDDAAAASCEVDAVVCRHVLEHLEDPAHLLQRVRRAVAGNGPEIVFFEVPNLLATLAQHAIWDLIYEHVLYFSPRALSEAFAREGFVPEAVQTRYGEQFLTLHARPGDASAAPPKPTPESAEGYVGAFAQNFERFVADWRERLAELERRGRRAVVWGTGSKGVMFLNLLGLDPEGVVAAAVDVNPRKQGGYVPGTGHPILSPDALCALRPDDVIVMNPLYTREIEASLQGLGLEVPLHRV